MTLREDNYLNVIYKWLLYPFFWFHSVPLSGFQISVSHPLSISTSTNLLGMSCPLNRKSFIAFWC